MAPCHIHTYGWTYNPELTPDENYSDLALLTSRNSSCDGGHMGVALVKENRVLALAVNSTLYAANNKSDVHAEANCLCLCARRGVSTEGASMYITMPPCKNCFGLLQAAGVKRVVYRRQNRLEDMMATAERLGIEMVGCSGHEADDASHKRVKSMWDRFPDAKRRKGSAVQGEAPTAQAADTAAAAVAQVALDAEQADLLAAGHQPPETAN